MIDKKGNCIYCQQTHWTKPKIRLWFYQFCMSLTNVKSGVLKKMVKDKSLSLSEQSEKMAFTHNKERFLLLQSSTKKIDQFVLLIQTMINCINQFSLDNI